MYSHTYSRPQRGVTYVVKMWYKMYICICIFYSLCKLVTVFGGILMEITVSW